MRFIRAAAVAALLVTSAMAGSALAAGPTATQKKAANALVMLSQINLAVKQNWTFNGGGEVEGKVYVGGNVLGSSQTQIGFGASNGQGTAASAFATVTVGGYTNVGFQITNAVGGSYGAYIGGASNGEINVLNSGATVKVGGNANSIKVMANQTTWVGGNYTSQNGLDLSTNGQVWIGGTATRIQGGSSNAIMVGGKVDQLYVNANSSAVIGRTNVGSQQNPNWVSIGQGQAGQNTTVTALGNISNFDINGGNATVKTNGTFSNGNVSGGGSLLYARGGTSGNVNNNTGNQNAIKTGPDIFTGAVTAPADPGAPLIASLTDQTAAMFDNFKALSDTLRNLNTAGHAGVLEVTNGGQAYTFSSGLSTGYTVFNVNETIFSKNELAYNFLNASTPVIINVKHSSCTANCSYAMTSNFTGDVGRYNRNVIWNFVDAGSVVLDRQFQGSVLAYLADLQSNVIEGSVVAKNFTQTNEIHLGTFNRNDANSFVLTGAVPEPANWLLMIAGFGLIGGTMRRRRAFAAAA